MLPELRVDILEIELSLRVGIPPTFKHLRCRTERVSDFVRLHILCFVHREALLNSERSFEYTL